MSVKDYPSIELVRQSFVYDDGHLYWLARPRGDFSSDRSCNTWNARFAGKECGYAYLAKKSKHYRWIICFHWKPLFRYSIVWAIHKGEWRIGLDHINRNALDDRIDNLRVATQSQNNANIEIRSDNTSGCKGVSWDKARRKWLSHIKINRQDIFLGRFDNLEDAHVAYVKAAQELFGEFACGG